MREFLVELFPCQLVLEPDFARGSETVRKIERCGRDIDRTGTRVVPVGQRRTTAGAERSHDFGRRAEACRLSGDEGEVAGRENDPRYGRCSAGEPARPTMTKALGQWLACHSERSSCLFPSDTRLSIGALHAGEAEASVISVRITARGEAAVPARTTANGSCRLCPEPDACRGNGRMIHQAFGGLRK